VFKEAPIGIFSYNDKLDLTAQNTMLHTLIPKEDKERDIHLSLKEVMQEALSKNNAKRSKTFTYNEIERSVDIQCFTLKSNRKSGIGIVEDKTSEYTALQQLTFFANHDPLTNLYNRRSFKKQMQQILHDPKPRNYSLLYYVDLDQFKEINDSLGHYAGDEILRAVAERLEVLFPNAILSRLGGDEFIIFIANVAETKEELKRLTTHYEESLIETFQKPITVEELPLYVYFSAGVVIIEPEDNDIDTILHHADITMYHAKKSFKNITYYDPRLSTGKKEAFVLQNHFKNALHQNELELFFQPIAQIKDNRIIAAEALLRWHHPQQGLLYPKSFLHFNMKTELLSKITWWTIEQTCKQIVSWKKEGVWFLEYISVNINITQLTETMFVQQLLELLNKYHIDTSEILLEITEHSLIHKFEHTQSVLNELQSFGIRCAIDDFGIGYSSLSYLKKLSFYTLKIDKEFVKDIETSSHALNLISIIFDMAHHHNYHIVVEGIEEQEQRLLLCDLDNKVHYQGFILGKAVPAPQFIEDHFPKESS
jgi:diguanylate cyclase (GGDEF)-like protein